MGKSTYSTRSYGSRSITDVRVTISADECAAAQVATTEACIDGVTPKISGASMFSRSEKTDEVIEPTAEPDGEKSPLVMAGLAGLLAVAGAFLLVWYLSGNGSGDSVAEADGNAVVGEDGGLVAQQTRQVLIVTQNIPRGTSVSELIDAPTVYLSAEAVPENFVAATAIATLAELQELDGFVLASEALEGEQLLTGRFRDPSDFDAGGETFLEAATGIDAPEGHHAVTFQLPATRAMGGNIRPGEQVTVIGSSRVGQENLELSIVTLNAVEVLVVDKTNPEAQGELSQDINQSGIATQGDLVITVAVKPEELADMTFTLEFMDVILASAVNGLDNEEGPRAATTGTQILGDDGVWIVENDDGNLIDLLSLLETEISSAEGSSIELDLTTEEAAEAANAEAEAEEAALVADEDGGS